MVQELLGTDLAVANGDLVVQPGGDVDLVDGTACLAQDLANRLRTPVGGLLAHTDYGSRILELAHETDSLVNRLDLEQELRAAAEADPRVVPGSARAKVLSWTRDGVRAQLSLLPVGETNRLNLVLGYGVSEITAEVATANGL